MKIPGTGQDLLDTFTKLLNKGDSLRSESKSTSISEELSYYTEALHVDIELADGTLVGLDYIYEAMAKKTVYEISAFSDHSYRDDYFSPENTANRILEFMKSLWDGSKEQFTILAKAIDQGIDEAKEILGNTPDWLGQTINKTVDLVHEGLEAMEQEIAENP